MVVIKAHDAKIYGIDWDRRYRHKLVTCSLGWSAVTGEVSLT